MNKNKNLSIKETFALAIQNHQKNNFQIAENLYNKILKIEPSHPGANNNIGVMFQGLANYQKAISYYEKVIEIDSKYPNTLCNLGMVFQALGENQKAIDYYKKAIELNTNDTKAHYGLGILILELKELQKAKDCFEKVIKIDSNFVKAHHNLGVIFNMLSEHQKAINCYEKAIKIVPDFVESHNNLGIIFKSQKEYQKAINYFEKAIEINPNYTNALNNLGITFYELEENQKAKSYFEKAIKINPKYASAHNNLGIIHNKLGDSKNAISLHKKAIEIDPNFNEAHYNLGIMYQEVGENQKAEVCYKKVIKIDPNNVKAFNIIGDQQKAKDCFEKVIKIDPNDVGAYWNLHSVVSNIDEAIKILKKLYEINNNYIRAKIMISALEGCKGNFDKFNDLMKTPEADHPYARSTKWVFSLPELPKIFLHHLNFYDAVIALSDTSRPFYEFGVWRGNSFKHLIKTYKTGFGFDTFTGLPEDWYDEKRGTYPSFGSVPKIKGGEFIVGKFEDTLPKFFSKKRPTASLINFDADLYSSTLCALNNSKKVIDDKTVLIFDEFIMTKNWEQDEFKALNEFCDNLDFNYEVLAVSFFSRQVAVKIKKN